MPEPTIQLLGAYAVQLTDDLFKEAMASKYGGVQLSDAQRRRAEADVREELSSVVLLELLVLNADSQFSVDDFSQPDSDQAAYDEAYLTADGTSVVSRYDQPATATFRVTFFLHFFDPSKPVSSSYGPLHVPEVQKMPARLQGLVPYMVVD
jgi:hypothetical protein